MLAGGGSDPPPSDRPFSLVAQRCLSEVRSWTLDSRCVSPSSTLSEGGQPFGVVGLGSELRLGKTQMQMQFSTQLPSVWMSLLLPGKNKKQISGPHLPAWCSFDFPETSQLFSCRL